MFQGKIICDPRCNKPRLLLAMFFTDQISFGHMDIVQQAACLVVNPITVDSYGFLFKCTMVGQNSDLMLVMMFGFNQLVGA